MQDILSNPQNINLSISFPQKYNIIGIIDVYYSTLLEKIAISLCCNTSIVCQVPPKHIIYLKYLIDIFISIGIDKGMFNILCGEWEYEKDLFNKFIISPYKIQYHGNIDLCKILRIERAYNKNILPCVWEVQQTRSIILYRDADIISAIHGFIITGQYKYQQSCGTYVYIEESIFDKVIDELKYIIKQSWLDMYRTYNELILSNASIELQNELNTIERLTNEDINLESIRIEDINNNLAGIIYYPITPSHTLYIDPKTLPIILLIPFRTKQELYEILQHKPQDTQQNIWSQGQESITELLKNDIPYNTSKIQCNQAEENNNKNGVKIYNTYGIKGSYVGERQGLPFIYEYMNESMQIDSGGNGNNSNNDNNSDNDNNLLNVDELQSIIEDTKKFSKILDINHKNISWIKMTLEQRINHLQPYLYDNIDILQTVLSYIQKENIYNTNDIYNSNLPSIKNCAPIGTIGICIQNIDTIEDNQYILILITLLMGNYIIVYIDNTRGKEKYQEKLYSAIPKNLCTFLSLDNTIICNKVAIAMASCPHIHSLWYFDDYIKFCMVEWVAAHYSKSTWFCVPNCLSTIDNSTIISKCIIQRQVLL